MIEVKGKYNDAIIYSDRYDDTAYKQILDFCNLKSFSGAQICVMPDYHAGKGCVVGFTASNVRYLIPNVIGVDIGCGILAVKLNKPIKNLEKLDMFINEFIPSGFDVNEKIQEYFPLKLFHCCDHFYDTDRLRLSLGSLGGGKLIASVQVNSLQ